MAKKKKKRNRKPIVQSSRNKQNEYDLKSSLKKLNQRKNLPNSETSTEFEINKPQPSEINQSSLNENLQNETSAIYVKLSESFNTRYDTLNDSINNVNDKIVGSSSDLRLELETKIGEKLETKFFLLAVSVLMAVSTLIYTLSYTDLISDTKDNSESARSLEKDIEIRKDEIKELKNDHEKMEEKQKELEIKFIKFKQTPTPN